MAVREWSCRVFLYQRPLLNTSSAVCWRPGRIRLEPNVKSQNSARTTWPTSFVRWHRSDDMVSSFRCFWHFSTQKQTVANPKTLSRVNCLLVRPLSNCTSSSFINILLLNAYYSNYDCAFKQWRHVANLMMKVRFSVRRALFKLVYIAMNVVIVGATSRRATTHPVTCKSRINDVESLLVCPCVFRFHWPSLFN